MVLRSDEAANQAESQRDQNLRKNVKKGVALAATGGTGAGLASKLMPFLSEYIPEDLSLKGISKLAPKVGEFLKSGTAKGLTLGSGLEFLKEQFSKTSSKAPAEKSIIEQYSPELHQFLKGHIQSGRAPLEAAALAQLEGKGTKGFKAIIAKLVKEHKAPFDSIVESIFGSGQTAQPQQQQVQQQAPDQQMQGQEGIDPQLAQILQQGNQILQGFRGR
jgi:hypothetical protein